MWPEKAMSIYFVSGPITDVNVAKNGKSITKSLPRLYVFKMKSDTSKSSVGQFLHINLELPSILS